LAGLLLKLGGYGIVRRAIYCFVRFRFASGYLLRLGLVGAFFVSLVCLRQVDLKRLVAYSSVVHIGVVLGGLFSFTSLGIVGGIWMMIAHGLCSSGLFYGMGLFYSYARTRRVMSLRGFFGFHSYIYVLVVSFLYW